MSKQEVRKPWEHQQKAIDFGLARSNSLFLYDVGTGKTGIAINLIRFRSAQKGSLIKAVIMGPTAILKQFKDEFPFFSRIGLDKITVLQGTGKKKAEQVRKLNGKDHIIITNYEALLNEDLHSAIMDWGPEMFIGDEIHMLKNYKAKRSKLTAKIAHKCLFRSGMTGTGILQGVQDLFMVFYVLDGGATFGDNFFAFRGKYMVDKNAAWSGRPNHFPKWVANPNLFEALNEKIYANAIQAKKEDCLELPDFVRKTVTIPMPPAMKKIYDQMERDFMVFLKENEDSNKSGAVVAQLAVTKALRLLQITSGFATDDEDNIIRLKSNPKLDYLDDLMDQLHGEKVIIWACFKENHKMISELLTKKKIKHVVVNGDISIKEKQTRIWEFQNDPTVLAIVGSQAAMGTGVNLQQAGYSIKYSKNHKLGDDLQSDGRNYRGGSIDFHKKVTRIDLEMEGTLDVAVGECLADKKEVSDSILNYRGKGEMQ